MLDGLLVQVHVRVLLHSDGADACALQSISINELNDAPREVPSRAQAFGALVT